MTPKVSILTPTYNHQAFIAQCITSVLVQSFSNWEMIIVDDASTDNTCKIASRFAEKDKRIKLIGHKKNWGIGGLAKTYNQALAKAKSEYVAILEGDDYWPADKLKNQVRTLADRKTVLSFGDCILTNQRGQPIKLFTYNSNKDLLGNNPPGSITYLFASLNFSMVPVTVMVRKSALQKIGGFRKDRHYPFVDIPTFLNLSLIGKFSYQKRVLGFYRKQSTSSWYNFAKGTSAMAREEIQTCVNEFLNKNKENRLIRKMLLDQKVLLKKQVLFIKKKKKTKGLSLFLNKWSFAKAGTDILPALFKLRYFFYNFAKMLDNPK